MWIGLEMEELKDLSNSARLTGRRRDNFVVVGTEMWSVMCKDEG